jgi:hypothetical protein
MLQASNSAEEFNIVVRPLFEHRATMLLVLRWKYTLESGGREQELVGRTKMEKHLAST